MRTIRRSSFCRRARETPASDSAAEPVSELPSFDLESRWEANPGPPSPDRIERSDERTPSTWPAVVAFEAFDQETSSPGVIVTASAAPEIVPEISGRPTKESASHSIPKTETAPRLLSTFESTPSAGREVPIRRVDGRTLVPPSRSIFGSPPLHGPGAAKPEPPALRSSPTASRLLIELSPGP
jgi:hypothetical protein